MPIDKSKILSFLEEKRGLKNNDIIQYVLSITRNEFKKIECGVLRKYDFFYWNKPEEDFMFLAVVENSKILKFDAQLLGNRMFSNYKNDKNIIPLFVGGKKFANYKNSSEWEDYKSEEWLLPKFIILKTKKDFLLVINFKKYVLELNIVDDIITLLSGKTAVKKIIKPKIGVLEKLNQDSWSKSVNRIIEQINSKKIFKTVMAVNICTALKSKVDENYLIKMLFRNNKAGCLFLFKKNNSLFFGASPEKLFSLKNNLLQTEALAGTTKRGNNKEEDKKLEIELLKSKKNLEEHKSVIKYLKIELAKISNEIKISSSPKIKKLKYVQHLQTQVSAKIKKGENVFDIINILHPTPAVCGYPKKSAMKLINKLEKFDRGLYSGAVGWANKNEAEFAVAIRSALINKNKLYAYAGSGIVKDSIPIDELNEINFKLKTVLSLFKK